jgi:hypothetical protein
LEFWSVVHLVGAVWSENLWTPLARLGHTEECL